MTRQQFQDWLDRYVEAWKTYDPAKIGALFSEDAQYRYHPQDDPVVGREAAASASQSRWSRPARSVPAPSRRQAPQP